MSRSDCKYCDPNYEPSWPLTPEMEVACEYTCRHGSECGTATSDGPMWDSAICRDCGKIYCEDHRIIILERCGLCETCYNPDPCDNCLFCDDVATVECDNQCGSRACDNHKNKFIGGICHHCNK